MSIAPVSSVFLLSYSSAFSMFSNFAVIKTTESSHSSQGLTELQKHNFKYSSTIFSDQLLLFVHPTWPPHLFIIFLGFKDSLFPVLNFFVLITRKRLVSFRQHIRSSLLCINT